MGVLIDGEKLRERSGLPAAETPERALKAPGKQPALDADGDPLSAPGSNSPQKGPGGKSGAPGPEKLPRRFLELLSGLPAGDAKATAAADDREPDFVDLTTDEAIDDWAPLVEPLLSSFETLAEDCTDLLQFQARLAEGLAGMDSAAFEELLARGLFAARITGEVDPARDGGT